MARRTNVAKWIENKQHWKINVQKDGKRRSFYSSIPGRNGQRECHKKADAWLDDGIDGDITLERLYANWLAETKAAGRSRSYWSQYDYFWRCWVEPTIKGRKKVHKITEQNLQDVILAAFAKGLAEKTLKGIRAFMSTLMKYARKGGKTKLHPESIYIPDDAPPPKEHTILQPRSFALLFSRDKTHMRGKEVFEPYIYAYRFAAITGLRPGEVIALENRHIIGNRIIIEGSINVYGERTKGKNKRAKRVFVLCDYALAMIREQKKLKLRRGLFTDVLFCDERGDHIPERRLYDRWLRFRDYHGLDKTVPYEMRHTFISITKDIPDPDIKRIVGHGEQFDTRGTYGVEVDGELEQAALTLNRILAGLIDGAGIQP